MTALVENCSVVEDFMKKSGRDSPFVQKCKSSKETAPVFKFEEFPTNDQVECIMAILSHRNIIKGYFSHESKVLVLSKQDAFPVLSARPLTEIKLSFPLEPLLLKYW
ncbi:unnamed protein product [Sphagnum jensenii]|uniref:Uncharacterized protein n=1 Tax=Sphagnum jensenii TaxID=128206 RepID=A0ABP0XL01_9BRYO